MESWTSLRPTWRVGQGHWFFGLHAGNVMHGKRGAIGVWGRNAREYGHGRPLHSGNGLWTEETCKGWIPAQYGIGLLARLMYRIDDMFVAPERCDKKAKADKS